MRRSLLTVVAVALFGSLLTASNASACCHKKAACPEPAACAPAPVECAPAPVAECAPKKKCGLFANKCGGGMKLGGLFKCHKKAECAPAPVCETVAYEAPAVAPSAQWVAPSGQASAQH